MTLANLRGASTPLTLEEALTLIIANQRGMALAPQHRNAADELIRRAAEQLVERREAVQ